MVILLQVVINHAILHGVAQKRGYAMHTARGYKPLVLLPTSEASEAHIS
jgi:hypothetical protein